MLGRRSHHARPQGDPDPSGPQGGLRRPPEHASSELHYDDPAYFDPESLERELRRVGEICHQCRRCTLGIHRDWVQPSFHGETLAQWFAKRGLETNWIW